MAKKKKLFRTTGGAGYVPPSPDVEALVRNILASDPERTKDILYRIISLGNSAEGTKYDRNAYDILRGVYDSFTDKPMDEDRYTGSWTWTEDGIKSNPERDWNLLFAKGNIKGLYQEIPKNELRGINLSNKYTSYYGNFVPKSHYDITDNYGPLLQYLANHNLGGLVIENGLGVVALPLSELEYQQAVRDKYTVDNVGRFNASIGRDPNGNPEVLFFDFGNFGREYGDTYGGDNAGLLGELLDTYGNPFILRLYVPINTLSKDQFNALPEDDKWNVEDMNTTLLNIANANKVPVMQHDLDTDTYETVFLPEVEKVANKRAEGGALHPEWNSLSMRERAAYIRDAVSRGLNTVTDIRNDYNEFKGGGKKKTNSSSVLTFLNLLNESLKGNSRYNTTGWRKYLTDLAKMESSYRGDVTNSIGAKGYFLLMPSNRSASWSTPTQLFHEMYKLSDANMDYFRKNMTERDLKLAEQMGIDIYGLMAGAHLGGPKNALAALRGGRNNKDKNGTSVLSYMTRFSQTTPRQPISEDFKTVYFQPPIEETPEIEAPNPYVGYKLISLEDIDNLPLPSRISDDEIAFEGTAPETIITPEPQKLYIQYTPKEIFDQMSNMITPYEPVELPKPLTATERLKELSDNRVSLLLKDLEDSIIRGYRLNDFDKEKLRRDVEDLLFYRNMAAYGGGIGDDDLVQKNSTISVAGLPYVSTEVEISPEASLRRANRVYSNYDQAVDAPLSWGQKTARNTLRWLKDNVNENIPSGVSNCTLSATLWVDPTNPIKNASSIVNDPNRYNYEPIEAGQARVGDVLITRNPNDGSYHTMLISGYSNDNGVYDFDGTLMNYGKNEPLLTYSRGGHDASFIRRDIPLSIYLLNSDGKTEQHFFRYNKPSRVLKVILKARKKAYGGNLFDGTTQPTQQMDSGLNLYRRTNNLGETEYIYQETPDSEEILLTPTNKRFSDDPTNWDYKDASGREYSPRMVKPAVAQAELRPYEPDWAEKIKEATGYRWLVNKSNEHYNDDLLGIPARWAASWNNNTNPVKGVWNSPLAYGNIYSMAAKAAENVFLNPEGLQKTINLYRNSDGSYSDRYAWQKSLLGDVVEASMISPAVREAYAAAPQIEEAIQAAEELTPTQRIFKFLGKEVPTENASEWVKPTGDVRPGKNARWAMRNQIMRKHPLIADLRAQGVDVEKISLDDLKKLQELREQAIKNAFGTGNGRYAITDAKSESKLFGENIDAELQTTKGRSVEPGAIGSLTFDPEPLDKYLAKEWARYDREGAVPALDPELYEGFKVPGMIQNYAREHGVKGVSKDLYSASLFDMKEQGTGKGIVSGTVLLSPEKTRRVVSPKNFELVEISPNAGWHQYTMETLDGSPMASWQEGPIVGMTGTTAPIQFPVKNRQLFDISIIDDNGIMHVDPTIGSSVRRAYGGTLYNKKKTYIQKNKL